jgi:cell division transport system permease protein
MTSVLNSMGYFFRETLQSLLRNKFMAVASVLTVTLSMFILGVFLSLVMNMNHMAAYLETQVEMSVYLRDGLTTEQVMNVGKRLKALPDMTEISFTDQDQAMVLFRERLGDQAQILDSVNGNPLPASYSLSFANPDALKSAAVIVGGFDEVDGVQYGQDIIEKLYQISRAIRLGGMLLIVFLAGAELFIISNTIRLTVFARRREIQIMKYVGATNSFIRWPFMLEGMIIGLIGSGLASLILWQLYAQTIHGAAEAGLVFIPLIGVYPFMAYVTLFLLAIGIFIGALGSSISIRKYMKV